MPPTWGRVPLPASESASARPMPWRSPPIRTSSASAHWKPLCRGHMGPVCALLDARNGNGYAMYQNDFGVIVPPTAVVVCEFLPKLVPFTLILGDGAEVYRDHILATVPCACLSGVRDGVDAQDVALAAWVKYQAGETGIPQVVPLYLRPSQAERLYKEK